MAQLRFALRTLFRTPFVTSVAVLSLALGIGANAAIFSLFNQLLLRRLPVNDAAQLVNLSAPGPKPGSVSCGPAGPCDDLLSYPMFRDLEREQSVFTGIAAHRVFGANLAHGGDTSSGEGALVSGSYFPVLGLKPAVGRLVGPDDDRAPGQSPVVVLHHDYWRRRFGERRSVEGETMIVNGTTMTIVGVAPQGFNGTTLGNRPDVFVPITMRSAVESYFRGFDSRSTYWIYAFARLKPGVSLEAARTAINLPYQRIINTVEAPLQSGMSPQTMERFRERQLTVTPGERGQSTVNQNARAPVFILLAVTGVVLLIACANIANLLLARSASRAGEMAVRLSIGASRAQLIRQLLTESLILAALGGALGILFARWTLLYITSLLPGEATSVIVVSLDRTVLLFAALLSFVTGLLFGLFPAIHSTRPDVAATLKGVARQAGGSLSATIFRRALVTTQVMLSMLLLAVAGLFVKSLINISRADLGLTIDRLVTFGVAPRLNGYTPARSQDLFVRAEEALAAVPGVESVAASMVPLLAGNNYASNVSVQGFEAGPDTDANANFNEVGPGYFRTLGIRLIAGRDFAASDGSGSRRVAIVNQTFAKKFGLGRDAVGKLMTRGRGDVTLDIEIVGLVEDAKYSQVKGEAPPLFFLPYRQDTELGDITFYVKARGSAESLFTALQAAIKQLDPNLPVSELRTMRAQVEENVSMDRMMTTIASSFAVLATVLASIGLYGVLAYAVTQRTRELGLRIALGAAPRRVRGLIMRQMLMMTAIGGTIGLTIAWLLGSYANTAGDELLYQVSGTDPMVFATAAAILSVVAFTAAFIPALRASRLDPMRALRYE